MKAVSASPNKPWGKYLCVYFKDKQTIERAVIIAKLESDYQNIISKKGDDFGVFQFHTDTINSYGLDKNYLMTNRFYQFHSFERIMKDKLAQCKSREIPEACWHSATDKHYDRYSGKYKQIRTTVQKYLK